MSEEKIIKAIAHYQENLERYIDRKDEIKMIYCMEKLERLPITVSHLEQTGVGRTVNSVRKMKGIRSAPKNTAKSLVSKWKQMVTEEELESDEDDEDDDSEEDDDEEDDDSTKESDTDNKKSPKGQEKQDMTRDVTMRYSSHTENSPTANRDKYTHVSTKPKHCDTEQNMFMNNMKDVDMEIRETRVVKHASHNSSFSDDFNHFDEDSSSREEFSREEQHHTYEDFDHSNHSMDWRDERKERSSSSSRRGRRSKTPERMNRLENKENKDKHHGKDRHKERDREHERVKEQQREKLREKEREKERERERVKEREREQEKEREREKEREQEKERQREIEKERQREVEKERERVKEKEREKLKEREKEKEVEREMQQTDNKKSSHSSSSHSSKSEKHSSKHKSSSSRSNSSTKEAKDHQSSSGSNSSSKKESSKSKESDKSSKEDSTKSSSSHHRSSSTSRSSSNVDKGKDKEKSKDRKRPHEENSGDKERSAKKPKIDVSRDEGISYESGASFAEALGMIPHSSTAKLSTIKKDKKEPTPTVRPEKPQGKDTKSRESTSRDKHREKEKSKSSSHKEKHHKRERGHSDDKSKKESGSRSMTISPTSMKIPPAPGKVEDVNISSLLPQISTNYKPLGFVLGEGNRGNDRRQPSDDEALTRLMYSKTQRTKVYSGNKTSGKLPSLFDSCIRVLQDNLESLEYTGGIPYSILKPVIERANPDQLFTLEHHNPYIMEDSDELWQLHCQREFKNKQRVEMETWREMYLRCIDEREAKLKSLTANIKLSQDKCLPVRQTKLAYVDAIVKPPRNVAKKQARNGTASSKPAVTPSSRLNQLALSGGADKISVPNPASRNSSAGTTTSGWGNNNLKPKKAPLMAKTLQLMKGRFRR